MEHVKIIYATETNKALYYATKLAESISISAIGISEYEFSNSSNEILIIIISTHGDGKPPKMAIPFFNKLLECPLKAEYAIYGLGNSAYKEDYNKAGIDLHCILKKHGSTEICVMMGDELKGYDKSFLKFSIKIIKFLASKGLLKDRLMSIQKIKNLLFGTTNLQIDIEDSLMITPQLRFNLQKQGYHLVGTHSAVKMCRWTKMMLKGRGGCYKHAFYGIGSHRCMEMTPNLSCANKCIFCWRHHSNPVGTSWQWKIDDPVVIFEGALKAHQHMINQMRTASGVKRERYEEALEVRHCALSLVGEPISYPRINDFISLLHSKGISSFLVTNAQDPEALRHLNRVTQLYLSIDAPSKEQLKEIDRPLHEDFWDRFLESISIIRKKKERTVFRLTLIKGSNMKAEEYKDIIDRGRPDFIEVKGVTFCNGEIKMKDVPFYNEVYEFSEKLSKILEHLNDSEGYEIACEHEHSCSVLIASKKFKINGIWHTWIDFDRFSNGDDFYSVETPYWALHGSKERGFDPGETRVYRNKNRPVNNK